MKDAGCGAGTGRRLIGFDTPTRLRLVRRLNQRLEQGKLGAAAARYERHRAVEGGDRLGEVARLPIELGSHPGVIAEARGDGIRRADEDRQPGGQPVACAPTPASAAQGGGGRGALVGEERAEGGRKARAALGESATKAGCEAASDKQRECSRIVAQVPEGGRGDET